MVNVRLSMAGADTGMLPPLLVALMMRLNSARRVV
jgi:hypothetical protein